MSENREINLLHLELSASKAALKLIDMADGRMLEKAMVEAFEADAAAEGFHLDLDYKHWKSRFFAQLQYYRGQKRTESESTKAWKFEVKKKPAEVPAKPAILPTARPVTTEDVKKSLEEGKPLTESASVETPAKPE